MRSYLFFFVALLAGTSFVACGAQTNSITQTSSMNCGNDDPPLSTHDYVRAAGDVVQAHHLEVDRPFAVNGKMEVHVCNADLRVRTARDEKEVRLTVDQGDGSFVADSIRTLRIGHDHGVIQLKFPKGAHATVILSLPMGPGSEDEFNLGRGDLDFNGIGSAGSREINVGMGHMRLLVDGDKNYSRMEVNVGMGSLHDHRPGGQDGHFVVNKEYDGSGKGELEINVGMGTLDIRND